MSGTMVDHNYLFHREVSGCLRRILVDEVPQPFRFVDVGCGDATEIVGALRCTRIARYHGIDLSRAALDLAAQALAALDCPVTLEQRDFVEALGEGAEPADVVWIGLSLHHLMTPAKLAVMLAIHGLVGGALAPPRHRPSRGQRVQRSLSDRYGWSGG
jgi:hypothetical protein